MNKKRLSIAAITIIVPITLLASTATQDYVTWDESWNTAVQSHEPTHMVGRFEFPPAAPEDSFVTYVYSYGEIMIFSYADDNDCKMYDAQGGLVWSDTMMEDDYELIQGLEPGVYKVDIPRGSSVLSGDPFTTGIGTWYAVDQNSRPLSTKLLSVGPHVNGSPGHIPALVVFSYHDGTHVVVKNVDDKSVIWEGDLDSAEYFLQEGGDVPPIVYSVEASQLVSTMTGGGLGGMFIPAFNGTFTGRDFMTYQQLWTSGKGHDLQIVPWEDDTRVIVTDLDNPTDTIWDVFCKTKGIIKGKYIPPDGDGRALYIHSDKDISLPQNPWISYSASESIGFFLIRAIDRFGLGFGQEYFIPLEGSVDWGSPYIYSRLHVVAFENNTEIEVSRSPRGGENETTIYEGTLNAGEYYRYTCPLGDEDAWAVYHVTASRRVTTIGNCRDFEGSDFYPVINARTLVVRENPEVYPPLDWQVLNTVGRQILLQYANHPEGFRASIFDATGRKVDELHSTGTVGTISWPVTPGYSPGVYFIKAEGNYSGKAQKVILVK